MLTYFFCKDCLSFIVFMAKLINIKNTLYLYALNIFINDFTTKNSGEDMIHRFDEFLSWLNKKNNIFGTFKDFLEKENLKDI